MIRITVSDFDIFSLGLVIDTQTFSVSVSVSMIQIWSRSSLCSLPDNINDVSVNVELLGIDFEKKGSYYL